MSAVPSLADLASDIIRQVIGTELESIDEIRLISHRWNSLATARLGHRKGLPAIISFAWYTSLDTLLRPIVQIPNQYKDYFGVADWDLRTDEPDEFATFSIEFMPSQYELMDRHLTRLFSRCSMLQKFVITEHKCWNFELVRNKLRHVIIRDLVVVRVNQENFNSKLVRILIQFMQTYSVQNVFLRFLSITTYQWSQLKKEIDAFLQCVTPNWRSFQFEIQHNRNDYEMDEAQLQNIWQARMMELNVGGNLTMTRHSAVIKIQRS